MGNYLEKRGINNMKKGEEVSTYILAVFLNILLITGVFFLIPNLIVSVIVVTTLVVTSSICFFVMEKVDPDDLGVMLYVIGISTIPCTFLSYLIVLSFIPYRGQNEMKIRQLKLIRLKRKAKINKFKFWK